MSRGHYRVLEKFGFARKAQYSPLGLSTTPVRTPEARIPMQTTAVKGDASLSQENTPEGNTSGDSQSTLVNTEVRGLGSDFIVRRPPGAPMRAPVAPLRTSPGGVPQTDSEFAQSFIKGMHEWTATMREQQLETTKSLKEYREDTQKDKPVPGIPTLEPERGYKLKVRDFVSWLKGIEEAWSKVGSTVE